MRHVSDIVRSRNPLKLPPNATVRCACECMRERKVGAVLVVDEGQRLLGIFTGRDAIGRVVAEGRNADRTQLSEVMTTSPGTISPDRPAIDALRLMFDIGCRHIPIVNNGRLVGIVSRADFRGTEFDRLDEEIGLWERI